MAGNHRHGDAVTAHCGAVDPWNAAAHGKIINQVTRFEVVGAVEDHPGAAQQVFGVFRRQIRHHAAHRNRGIDALQPARRGDRLGQCFGGIGFFEQPLAMEIGGLDVIAVDDGEPADAGPRQRGRVKAA